MPTVLALRRPALPFFLALLAGVYAAALVVAERLPGLEPRAGVVAAAVTLDLVVLVPLAFYVLVVRPRGLPAASVVPVIAASVLAASRVLPPEHRGALHALEVLTVPLELALVVWIVRRARRALGGLAREPGDPLVRLHAACRGLTGHDRAAAVLATEVAVLSYGLASWRSRPHAPPGTSSFTHHRRSGHAGVVVAFGLVLLIEGLAVHVLLARWSTLAAWIATAGTAYGALWLLADYRATVLRPILVDGSALLLRAGLRCTLVVPLDCIVSVERRRPELGKEAVALPLLTPATHWVVLSEACVAEGPYGFRRRVRAIGVAPDDPEAFERRLGHGTER